MKTHTYVYLKKKNNFIYIFPNFIFKIYFWTCLIVGELDPERIGSGIQYGDASLRRLTRHQQRQSRSLDCSC